jgi:glyoxylase-like metal-dependent hydrolase (beta-lactamase superfamily II)
MANPLEAQLQYTFGDTLPAPGQVQSVAPGVGWVRMALPFALDHINLWLLRDGDRWTIVDCGITDDATRSAWEQVFATSLDGRPVGRVMVTHMHPDHIGLAHWLCERWSVGSETAQLAAAASPTAPPPLETDCRLWISATDWNAARLASQSTTGFGGETAARFFGRHGLTDPEALAKVRARSNYYASMVPRVPQRFRRLLDGDRVVIDGRDWRCIAGYGHAPEHMSLYCAERGVLISGDMVLPRISTNVSVIDLEPEADPLTLYLRSLDALRALPADTLVLPSHGKPFRGLHTRIDQLHTHHAERLSDLLAACRQAPCSAADALPVLFRRKLDLHQTTFAMGEAIAHLHALERRGAVQAVDSVDGVLRYAAT